MDKKILEKRNAATILMLIGTICFFADNHILSIALPLLITDMGYPLKIIGQCTAIMGAVTIIMKFITPCILNSFKLKLLLIFNFLGLVFISYAFIPLGTKSSAALIILRALFGIPFSFFPIANLLIIAYTSRNTTDKIKLTSILGMAMPISMMISPLLTELLLKYLSYSVVFHTAFICSLLCFLFYMGGVYLLGSSAQTNIDTKEIPDTNKNSKTQLREIKSVFPPIAAFFFLGIADMLIITYFPLLAEAEKQSYSMYFIMFSLSMTILQKKFPSLKIQDRTKLIIGYSALSIAGITAYYASGDQFYILSALSAVTFGIGYGLTETTTNTIMMEKKSTGTIITIQQLSICLGRTCGPWFISYFSKDIQQLKICFLVTSFILISPAFFFLIENHKHKFNF